MQKTTQALILLALAATAGCRDSKTEYFDSSKIYLFGRPNTFDSPYRMPTADLPDKRVIDSYVELTQRGLLNHRLHVRAEHLPWGSGFFPTWFGGVAGRWQDSRLKLVWRSLWGIKAMSPFDAETLLTQAQKGERQAQQDAFRLSPTEKYDYAMGDYTGQTTREEALLRGHNAPGMLMAVPFWTGYCNGVAVAATRYAEPFREVDVVNPDGYHVRFHPNDIKGLLSLGHSHTSLAHWQIGSRCDLYTTSTLECNDINPASLVLALANRIGMAHEPFIVDQNPLAPVINSSVRSAEITVVRPPYPAPPGTIAVALIDVKIDIEVASTLLSTNTANVREAGEGVFKHVQNSSSPLTYEATIALDQANRMIGGRWTGRKMSGPDFIWGVPRTAPDDIAVLDRLDANRHIRYSVLQALYAKSISTEREIPSLEITTVIPNDETELFAYYTKKPEAYKNPGQSIQILGRLGQKYVHLTDHMNCTAGPDYTERPEDVAVTNVQFTMLNRHGKFLDFDLPAAVNRASPNRLKCYFYGPGPNGTVIEVAQSKTTIIYP